MKKGVMRLKLAKKKRIALIAHDRMKKDLIEWVEFNKGTLSRHELYATGTTGTLIEERTNLKVHKFKSGPLGGDQQIGAKIAEGEIDILIFFWDPLEPLAHDVDIKALIRLATVYNIPVAINRSSADFLISSPLFESEYEKIQPDYETQLRERIMKVVGEVKHSD
ncbi:MAG: methylglyoxal synthase [Pseudothermotoga sp.]|nr:methylglyoxal synthase [Pseudothermotoga sp.]